MRKLSFSYNISKNDYFHSVVPPFANHFIKFLLDYNAQEIESNVNFTINFKVNEHPLILTQVINTYFPNLSFQLVAIEFDEKEEEFLVYDYKDKAYHQIFNDRLEELKKERDF